MRIGVTGIRGRVGSVLVGRGLLPITGDIGDEEVMARQCRDMDVIINCAAFTNVDAAETKDDIEREKVIYVNTKGPGILRCAFDGLLIHLSTAYVFDGKDGPYAEDAVPDPINFYGMTKLGGEAAAAMRQPTIVVRTLDLYGSGPKSDFVRRTRDALYLGQPVALPTGLYGSPTYVPHLCQALVWLAQGWSGTVVDNWVLNVVGDGNMSRYAWGRKVAETFGFDKTLVVPSDKEWGVAARPLRGGLLVDKARRLGVPIYSPDEGLAALLKADGGDNGGKA